MDQGALVAEQIADGKRLLERLVEEGVTVHAACWIRRSESSSWDLLIVSSLVGDTKSRTPAIERVVALLQQMPQNFLIDRSDIRLMRPNDPISKALLELIRARNGKLPYSLGSGHLGGISGMSIDAGYIYPPMPMPTPVQQD